MRDKFATVSHSASVALVLAGLWATACDTRPIVANSPAPVLLKLACATERDTLACRASSSDPRAGTDPADVTSAVTWSSSDATIASVQSGRVAARVAGTATIAATLATARESGHATITVLIDRDRGTPQLAYEVEGAVRDSSNSAVGDVEVTLVDDEGRERRVATARALDGVFRFPPVVGGRYHVRAFRRAYRAVSREITVPDRAPLTLVLLADPAHETETASSRP